MCLSKQVPVARIVDVDVRLCFFTVLSLRTCVWCVFRIFRLLSKTSPDRLPQLCALIVVAAREGALGGEALLALADALTWVGRPLPLKVKVPNS